MAKNRKATHVPTPLDRLTDLRKSVDTGHVMAELLDVLIDAHGGDSEAVHEEIAAGAGAGVDVGPGDAVVDGNGDGNDEEHTDEEPAPE